ncbi:MAG TPA: magnesium/cobalt transporter CorA [Dehalococcoidia bacterium]|nr:magnesium/cobalt transporter CorA [Dehalococcoidia bacterium]
MACKAYYLNPEGQLYQDISREEIKNAYESKEGLLWIDISETTQEDGEFLEQDLGLHHLAVEDCVSPDIHSPKIDDFGDYLFIVVHGINHSVETEIVETAELAVFLGPHFVASNHNYHLYSVGAIQQLVAADGRPMRRGADFLAYALIDALIDNVMPTIDRMSDVAEEIEEETIRNPQQTTLEAILKLKRSTLRVHRVMAPQREVLNRISRGGFPQIKAEALMYYRDIYDHLVRIEDLNQTIRDRADNALNTYLSSVANRQNEVMKTLAVVATIFMPLTLLAGIYGMNFENMPELKWSWGYFAVLGIMGVAVVIALWRFWASNWFSWGRRRISRVKLFTVEPEKLLGNVSRLAGWPRRRMQ